MKWKRSNQRIEGSCVYESERGNYRISKRLGAWAVYRGIDAERLTIHGRRRFTTLSSAKAAAFCHMTNL